MPYRSSTPMLTNIPETAEEAVAAGQPTYFLSDRPETEEFLETFPGRPYKRILRDVRERRPTKDQLSFSQAWNDFKGQNLETLFGGQDPDMINPTLQSQNARNKYLQDVFGSLPQSQINAMDPAQISAYTKEAERQGKAELEKAKWGRQNALKIKQQFYNDWKAYAAERKGQMAKKAISPVDLQTAYPELTAEEAGSAAQAWNAGNTGVYNKIIMGKKRIPKGKETREIKRGTEIITEERDPISGEWKEIAKAPREIKTPSFKETKLNEMWDRLDEQTRLKALDALPPEKELTEKNILDVYGNIFTDAATKKALQPIVEEIVKGVAKKKIPGVAGPARTRVLPAGAKKIGTLNGKDVYQTPDGKRYVAE